MALHIARPFSSSIHGLASRVGLVEDALIDLLVVPLCIQGLRLAHQILLLLETSCPPQVLAVVKFINLRLHWRGVLGVLIAWIALICYPSRVLTALSHLPTILLSMPVVLVSFFILSNEVYLPWGHWVILSVLFLARWWIYPTIVCLLKLSIQMIVPVQRRRRLSVNEFGNSCMDSSALNIYRH